MSIERWRVNGACKTWKTRPEAFSLPIKYGLRGYSHITESNAGVFHLAEDCQPVVRDQRKPAPDLLDLP